MKETGIIMSGDHPRKILDGTKTMTRRTWGLEWINLAPAAWEFLRMEGDKGIFKLTGSDLPSVYAQLANVPHLLVYIKCPYGGVGDKLWCKETTWRGKPTTNAIYDADLTECERADMWDEGWRKFPSIFMPRRVSRIDRVITGLRAERLQEISIKDSVSEGVPCQELGIKNDELCRAQFADIWDSLNSKQGYSWEINPWVWPISW